MLEGQLSEKEKHLKDREVELQAAKRQLAELEAASDQTVRLFQADANEKEDLLRARETALKEQEKSSEDRLRALETQLVEKQGLVDTRSGEVESLRSKPAARSNWRMKG